LSAFIGIARTTFRAGLALIVITSPVNGFFPGLAFVAGLRTTLSLSRPGTTVQQSLIPQSLSPGRRIGQR
jgi:hypothetical protein